MNTQPNIQETIDADPEMGDAFRRAQSGQFEHTIFEMWENQFEAMILQTERPLGLPMYDSLLRTYPWLQYGDIPVYNSLRNDLLVEALDGLRSVYPKPAKHLFKEVVDDWGKHKDAYIDALVMFGQLTNSWSERWTAVDVDAEPQYKRVLHCVVLDLTSAIVQSNGGLTESITALQGFELTEAESEQIGKRILGIEDEEPAVDVTSEGIDV